MVADVVKDLGYLTLGTRLKRLGERLQAQSQVLLDRAGLDFPSSYFPLLASLDRLGSLSVGELSEAVGITQPGVTRMLEKLQAEDLVRSAPSAEDGRVRTIALTAKGRQVIAKAKRSVWPMVEAAVADACAHPTHELLVALATLEEALAAAPLHTRAERLRSGRKRHAST
jgi:DNA-binding MarR family transcriptional regulator